MAGLHSIRHRRFSDESRELLRPIAADLVLVAETALVRSSMEFQVEGGWRTRAAQDRLVEQGKSRHQDSRHCVGRAIDVVPIGHDGRPDRRDHHFYAVARAFASAARHHNKRVRWGGAWQIANIGSMIGDDVSAQWHSQSWVDKCRRDQLPAWTELHHFELSGET